MKLKFLIVLVLLVLHQIKAQDRTIDSLQAILKSTTNDTIKCNILFELSNLLPEGEWQKANNELIDLSKRNLLIAKNVVFKNFYNSKYATAIETKAYEQTEKGNYSDAVLNLYIESLTQFEKLNDKESTARLYNNIGLHYYLKSDYKHALNYYQKALAITKATNNYEGTLSLLNNIASIYHDTKNFKQALNYYRECLLLGKLTNNEKNTAQVYNNIGTIYNIQHKVDSAVFYLQKSIDLSISISDNKNLGTALNNMGVLYNDMGNYKKALENYNKSLEISLKYQFKNNEAITYIRIVEVLIKLEDIKEAEIYATKALSIGKKINSLDVINRCSLQLIQIYKRVHNYKGALEMTDLYNATHDSINNKELEKALIQNQVKFEYDKKALTDSLKVIADKKITAVKLEKEKKQKLLLYGIILLVIVFAAFLFNRFRLISKQKLIIEKTNYNLSTANKDLERQHLLNQKIFSVISHDFKGPLLSLNLMLESFKTKSTDASLTSYVNSVNSEITTANEMLNSLLNWARTEINIITINQKSSLVQIIYNDTSKELKNKLEYKKLIITHNFTDKDEIDLPPDILRIALRNLLSNAIKFSFENSRIEMRFEKSDVGNTISIIDFGVGMNQVTQNDLFTKQVDTGLGTNNEEGFGVGLYIVSELLKKYKYKIVVKSEVNKGATFTILPI